MGWGRASAHLVGHFHDRRCPLVELVHPVRKSSVIGREFVRNLLLPWEGEKRTRVSSRQGYDNEVGSVEPFVLHEVRDESNGLNGFSQAHLVCQDPVQVVVVKGNQPLQAFDLQTGKAGDPKRPPGCCGVSRRPSGVAHLILLELSVHQQRGLLLHLLGDGVSHGVIGLEPPGERRTAVFIVHILFSISADKAHVSVQASPGQRSPGVHVAQHSLNDVTHVHLGHVLTVGVCDLLLVLHGSRRWLGLLLLLLRKSESASTRLRSQGFKGPTSSSSSSSLSSLSERGATS